MFSTQLFSDLVNVVCLEVRVKVIDDNGVEEEDFAEKYNAGIFKTYIKPVSHTDDYRIRIRLTHPLIFFRTLYFSLNVSHWSVSDKRMRFNGHIEHCLR